MKKNATNYFLSMIQNRIGKYVFLFILLIPSIVISVISYIQLEKLLTESSLERRWAIAYFAATTLESNFDTVKDIGISIAKRPQLIKLIEEGKWDEEIKLLENIPQDLPIIERLFLTDLNGTLKADTPSLPGVRGQNFKHRDWYKGVSKNWQPYLSEVYKRTGEPQYNVVSLAVPISSGNKKLGILVVQVRADTLYSWGEKGVFGNDGYIYYIDQNNHIVGHPEILAQGPISNVTSFSNLQNILNEGSGVKIIIDEATNTEQIVSLEKVPNYGWTVVASQPKNVALVLRNNALNMNAIVYGLFVVINLLFANFVLRYFTVNKEKEMLVNLQYELNKYKLALDNTSDHVIITDEHGVIIYANTAAERITGYSKSEMIGNKPSLWGGIMPKSFYATMWRTIKTEKKSFSGEINNKRKDGKQYTAVITISPVIDKQHNKLFFIGIERDISKEKELERMKDEFVSIASHELRTPLTAIDGLISMILDGEYGTVNENLIQPLKDVDDSSQRLILLVNDLLSVSRINAGKVKYSLTEFSLKEKLEHELKLLKLVAEKKGIELISEGIPDMQIVADKDKFCQIVNNIVGNAIKFTEKGKVTISTKEHNDLLEIIVDDTGMGIDKKDQPKIFDKFEQINSPSGNKPSGTGLGLYISREIAQKMGGDLWLVQSIPLKGSTFIFSVPKAKSELAEKIDIKSDIIN